ncbi:MAG: hypothetical protein RLZZ338_1893 [Cyanobacteriota bacterium]|jgi:hypothetical protein
MVGEVDIYQVNLMLLTVTTSPTLLEMFHLKSQFLIALSLPIQLNLAIHRLIY